MYQNMGFILNKHNTQGGVAELVLEDARDREVAEELLDLLTS